MENDDKQVGQILSRREVIKLLGAASVSLLVGCGPEEAATPTTAASQVVPTTAPATAAPATSLPNTVAPIVTTAAPTTAAATEAEAATAVPACVVRPELTEGPYFVDTGLNRADIRSDPTTGMVKEGVLLALAFNVVQVSGGSCLPLPGAVVDIWHCDALGVYSGVSDRSFDTSGQQFLRGHQVTNENGQAQFATIYPGWYPGRTVHIHFKIRTGPEAEQGYEFTSQLFFDEALSNQVYTQAPYAGKGPQNTSNSADNIYHDLLLLAVDQNDAGYAATFDIALDLTDAATGRSDSF